MPTDPQIPSSSSRTPRQAERAPRWFPWTSLMLVTGIFLGFYAYWEAPAEIGRWHLAAAREFWREADYGEIQGNLSQVSENRQKAFAKLEDALSWSPEEKSLLFQRAQWNLDSGQYEEALLDNNRLLERFPDELALLGLRAKIFHLLGRHAEAVKDAEHINNLSKTSGNPPRASALNELAYAKAIGKIDLDSALQEINDALESEKHPAFLDTRGFIYYQMGKYELALKDLDPAAEFYEESARTHAELVPLHRRVTPDIRKFEIELRQQNEPYAVIFYHRALVHEKLGHAAAAAADRKRVRELIGRDGDEKLF